MLKNIKFLLLGVFFGIVMAKAQVISWFRIYEMFRFEAFHMYGIIGSAVCLADRLIKIIASRQIGHAKRKETPRELGGWKTLIT